jgi:peptidoglycan pentaglycine glycine transferase (the first glycine)
MEAGCLMHVVEVTEARAWDRALLSLPNPHILQSWDWGEFKSRHGWRATRLLFDEGAGIVAAASVLERKVPRLPLSILYVSKGPALDWTDITLARRVLEELERLARRRRALLVKIDPDVYYPEQAPEFSSRPTCADEVARLLESRGWRFSNEQIQFRNTLLLDLTRSEDELLAAMKQKTRYNVRLADRRGVTIRRISSADGLEGLPEALDLFYRLYTETAQRDGFIIRPFSYYRDAWGAFLERGEAHLLLAEFKGETVAGLLVFTFGAVAWYMYGASASRHRRHMPNYLLQWEAIRQVKAAGCRLYDLWGAPDTLDESDPMWGVARFKLGLGGHLACGVGAWDLAANRIAYQLYQAVLPRYLGWLRSRNRAQGR